MRRILVSLSFLLAAIAGFVSTGPAAFAMRVAPPAGGSPVNVVPVVHHSGGLAIWQVALIAIASVVLMAGAVLGARLMRVSRRPASTPATG
jgi:hypothetical protein